MTTTLAPQRDPPTPEITAELRGAAEQAIALGLFGVPTIAWDGRLFWGVDALPMLRAAMQGDPWFDRPVWAAAGVAPSALVRR